MRALFLSSLVLSTLLLGCSGTDTSSSAGGGGPAEDADTMTFRTGPFIAPAGESLTCFYLDAKTKTELRVSGASGEQGPGGHHILIYYTDVPRAPTHHPCTNEEMLSWHQIAGSAGHNTTGAEGIITLPEGLAIKVPEGKQLVIQSHYINTTGKSEHVDDSVTIKLLEPSQVKAYANYFADSDETFEIPPNGSLTLKTSCTVPQDLKTVLYLGHMHQYGTRFSMAVQDGDQPPKMVYDESWQPLYTTHPPITYYSMDKPFELKKGQKVIKTCEWVNPTPQPITFPDEMCVGFFYYFPDAGELLCNPTPVP